MITQENIPYTADEIKAMVKTIEELRKKYNEALSRAKHALDCDRNNLVSTDVSLIYSMFPELKEDEEQIIERLKGCVYAADLTIEGRNELIAWLEKQSKGTSWKPSKEEMDVLYGLAYITDQYDEHKEEVITRLYQDLKREFFNGSSYENMFPNTEDGVRRRSTIQVLEYARSLDTYNQYGKADIDKNIAWLEKQSWESEVEPEDVKPKFKVGDWIVLTAGELSTTLQIVNVDTNKKLYWFNDDSYLPIVDEECLHLWTIEDAKDGDILMTTKTRNCPFIYRKTDYNNNLAYYYAGVDGDGDFCEGCLKKTMYHFGSVANITPATKEQRDLLFQKMKEAGYGWDNEKKELKKIEPKMLNADEVIEWVSQHICTACFDEPNEAISLRIDKFKKDFGL